MIQIPITKQKYEYDLDMSTRCENCDKKLSEGKEVFKDDEEKNTYYCSLKCAIDFAGI